MNEHSVWYVATDALADAVNPILGLVALVLIVLRVRSSPREAGAFAAATAVGLIGIYTVAAADQELVFGEY